MLPRAYVALAWPAADRDAAARVRALEWRLSGEPHWRRLAGAAGLSIWLPGERPALQPLPEGAGFVLGDLFPPSRTAAAGGAAAPEAVARRLLRSGWGRYVAVLRDPGDRATAVLRDPSGQVGCLSWRWDEAISLVAADLLTTPRWLWPPRLALDWARIGLFLADPAKGLAAPLFEGLVTVPPGALLTLGSDAPPEALWRPGDFVAGDAPPPDAAAEAVVGLVDAAAHALLQRYDRVLVELSGGLDSAIVGAAIAATGQGVRVAEWLNRRGDRPEGDEARYARAVTDRLGTELGFLEDPVAPITVDGLAALAAATWPSISGVDEGRDREEAARLRAAGAEAIVSGQGGDGVFFQMPTPLVFADQLRREGWRALRSPMLAAVARRTRRSAWQVLGAALKGAGGTRPPPPPSLAGRAWREAAAQLEHPWLAAADEAGVSGAKRLQIAALVNAQTLHGDSRRARVGDLLYPLLSQPLVELCLAIPAPVLAGGAIDRPFARRAFADRLPDLVLHRRAKGDMSSYFNRMVARSLDELRPFLLEGCLAEAGVLDRGRLAAALDPAQLIWTGGSTEIMWAATTEAWVRHWQTLVPDSERARRGATMAG